MKYHNSLQALEEDLAAAPDTQITALARKIIEGAKVIDVAATNNLSVHKEYRLYKNKDDKVGVQIERDYENPVEFTHSSVLGAPGASTFEKPLQDGEEWHKGRRASNTGIKYGFNKQGRFINPFLETGMTGQGLLWQEGINHAVDNGLLMIKPNSQGDMALHAIGIHRKDNPGVPYISGGFVKYKKIDGEYIADDSVILASRVEEFFEELISGSIDLFPEYEDRVQSEYDEEVNTRLEKINEDDDPLTQSKLDEIREQTITRLKMEQVRSIDSNLFDRISDTLSDNKECYAGPVLNSNRQTNDVLIETRMFWTELTEEKWEYIRGENPPFDYALAAGDDADGVHYFEMDWKLIDDASASHAPLFAFMAASYLLDAQEKSDLLHPNIISQLEDMAGYLDVKSAEALAKPEGFIHYKLG